MSKIYFVRHGESEANALNIASGAGMDVALTQRGRMQARVFEEENKKILNDIDHVFVSPLVRAQQTAKIIFKHYNTPMETLDDLKEIHVGALTGKPVEGRFNEDLLNNKIPGGENFNDFTERVINAFEFIAGFACKSPMIVAHGWLWMAMCHAKGLKPEDPPNCALRFIERDLFIG